MKKIILPLLTLISLNAIAGNSDVGSVNTLELDCQLDSRSLEELDNYIDPGALGADWVAIPKKFKILRNESSMTLTAKNSDVAMGNYEVPARKDEPQSELYTFSNSKEIIPYQSIHYTEAQLEKLKPAAIKVSRLDSSNEGISAGLNIKSRSLNNYNDTRELTVNVELQNTSENLKTGILSVKNRAVSQDLMNKMGIKERYNLSFQCRK